MRWMPSILLGLTVLLLAVSGCKTTPDLKPPPRDEVLEVPPISDKRYSEAPCYPSDTLTQNALNKGHSASAPDLKPRPTGAMPGSFSMGGP